MRLRIKNLDWLAGRPVALLNDKTAKKMNVFANDRIHLENSKRVYAVVDIFPKLVRKKEIGVSRELSKILNLKEGRFVEVRGSEFSEATRLIQKKMSGQSLTEKEISTIISEIVHNSLTEAEIAYFTAAEKLKGMSYKETADLTNAMVKTGVRLSFGKRLVADKHCIGGVAGNRTTPLVISICAAAGLTLPKTSSRAITSAAGTADVIETISNVELPISRMKEIVKKTNGCLAWGGSLGLAPSDDKIIRVERLLNLDIEPQLLASILSKKISAGSNYIIIDIPYGKGAKIPNTKKARELGKKFMQLAKHFKLKIKVVYTNGSKPIGNGIGPVLEMLDVIAILRNYPSAPHDLKNKSLHLSTELLKLCKIPNAKKVATEVLESGKAYEKFKEIINEQNGKKNFDRKIANLKPARFKKIIKAKKSGKITEVSNKRLNSACRALGTPETKTAGIYIHKKSGKIKKGKKLLTLHSESKSKLKDAIKYLKEFPSIKIK